MADARAADSHDVIEVRGARETTSPTCRSTSPSAGSPSSRASPGQASRRWSSAGSRPSGRLINETYTAFIQSFMPSVDPLHILSAATDAYTMLRIVFSRVGKPHVGKSTAFSFSKPRGDVPRVRGPRAGVGRSTSTSWWTASARSTRERSPSPAGASTTSAQWDDFLNKPATKLKIGRYNVTSRDCW